MPKKALNEKQKRFADEYMVDMNATQAAIRAGYSPKTAGSQSFDLLQKPEIQQYLAEGRGKLADRLEITKERILKEYARIAFLDPKKLYNDDGSLVAIKSLDDDTAAAIGGVDVTTSYSGGDDPVTHVTRKVKLVDKKGALDSLAKHLGMFVDKVEHSGNVTIQATNADEKL